MANLNIKWEWVWRTLFTIVMGVVSFLAWSYVDNLQQQLTELRKANHEFIARMASLETEQKTLREGRFTALEWATGKSEVYLTFAAHDKRITLIENAIIGINNGVNRIESKVDRLPKN
jgi:hypothetical protein